MIEFLKFTLTDDEVRQALLDFAARKDSRLSGVVVVTRLKHCKNGETTATLTVPVSDQ